MKNKKPKPRRELWGDPKQGELFEQRVNKKFGTEFGSRKIALEKLHLQRRIFNMYITGERYIPDDVWTKLRTLPDYTPPAVPANARSKQMVLPLLYIDDIDPLS